MILSDKIRKDFKNNINMGLMEYVNWLKTSNSKKVPISKNVVRKTRFLMSVKADKWNNKHYKLALVLLKNLNKVRKGKNSVNKRISLRNHGVRIKL